MLRSLGISEGFTNSCQCVREGLRNLSVPADTHTASNGRTGHPQGAKRLFWCVLVGPPVGAVLFFTVPAIVATLMDWRRFGFILLAPMFTADPLVLLFAYFWGVGPAILGAVLSSLAARVVASRPRRILLSPLLGALSTATACGLFSLFDDFPTGSRAENGLLSLAALLVIVGAVTALICTLLIEYSGSRWARTSSRDPRA